MIIVKKNEKIADIYIPKNESWVDYTVVDVKKLQSKDLTVVENGIVEVLPDDEYYALSSVEINVDVPEKEPQLEELYATENGEYTPNGDGYSKVTVDVPDLNGSYKEGYNQGYTEGKQVSYDEGYEQGQADVAANARVLDVTENGYYLSKFSDPIIPTLVTGVYDDGTEFYSYATVKSAVYNTNIIPTQDSKITIWVNLNEKGTGDAYFVLLSNMQKEWDNNFLHIRYHTGQRKMNATIGGSNIYFDVPQGWCKMEMSITDGLWVNDVKIGDFQSVEIAQQPIWINGSFAHKGRNINGEFGMIKIDDNVIIPTENGFMDNNGEMLEVIRDGDYVYTENLPKYGEGELYKTINVNVQPKINVVEIGLKFGHSAFESIPDIFDFEGITSLEYLFYSCGNLQSIPQFDTSKVENMRYAFYGCVNLKTIPEFDTSKVKTMYYAFGGCTNLQSIPKIDCSSIDNSYNSTAFFGTSTLNNLTDIGGFENLKISSNNNYGLVKVPNLTRESCINILNGLYDFVGNGVTPSSAEGKLKVHQNFLDLVGEEISIGTNKGWTITA